MDISNIPDDLKKREIFRYEQQAWHFLLFFMVLWAGLITVIVRAMETRSFSGNLIDHLFRFEVLISSLQGLLFWMLGFLLIYAIWKLRSAMVVGFIDTENRSLDAVLLRKYKGTMRGIRWGTVASVLLTLVCLYLVLLDFGQAERVLETLSNITVPVLVILLFLIMPVIENIIHLMQYTSPRGIFIKIIGVLSLYFCVGQFFPKAVAFLFSIHDVITMLIWGVFLLVLFSNLYFFIQKVNLILED